MNRNIIPIPRNNGVGVICNKLYGESTKVNANSERAEEIGKRIMVIIGNLRLTLGYIRVMGINGIIR